MSTLTCGATKDEATGLVIWLHGLGDTPHGWAQQAAAFALKHIHFILPTAPTQPVTCNGGARMTSWMDLLEIPIRVGSPDNGIHIEASVSLIHKLIDEAVATSGIPAERIVVGGFSQGAALALTASLRYPERLGGCFVLSGWALPKQDIPRRAHCSASKGVPFFIGHGTADSVVLPDNAQQVKSILHKSGCSDLTFKLYSGVQHDSSPNEMNDLEAFLARVLPAT